MTTFRFYHAADIHLDSPLRGLANIQGSAAERIRSAPREAFEAFTKKVIEDSAEFVIIAGDLYDGEWRDFKTGLFFAEQMGQLNGAHIPVFVVHGNHDAESQITQRLTLPDNVRVFGAQKAHSFKLDKLKVALHGQSFREPAVTNNLVPDYPNPLPNHFNIGVLHTALGGAEDHSNYAPCSRDELIAKGYDYWALGHVHQARVLHEHPHIVFPGNLQGRHIKEAGPKGAFLITVEDGKVVDASSNTFDVVRWAELEVDASRADSQDEVVTLIEQILKRGTAEADGRLLSARIVLRGSTELHGKLVANAERLTNEARSIALGLDATAAWVEKVKVETSPITDIKVLQAKENTFVDLQHILEDASADQELLEQLSSTFDPLMNKLDHEVKERCDNEALQAAIRGDYTTLIRLVTPHATLD